MSHEISAPNPEVRMDPSVRPDLAMSIDRDAIPDPGQGPSVRATTTQNVPSSTEHKTFVERVMDPLIGNHGIFNSKMSDGDGVTLAKAAGIVATMPVWGPAVVVAAEIDEFTRLPETYQVFAEVSYELNNGVYHSGTSMDPGGTSDPSISLDPGASTGPSLSADPSLSGDPGVCVDPSVPASLSIDPTNLDPSMAGGFDHGGMSLDPSIAAGVDHGAGMSFDPSMAGGFDHHGVP